VWETKIAKRPARCGLRRGTRGRLFECLSREGWVQDPGHTAIITHDVETWVGEETIVSAVLYEFDPPLMDKRDRRWRECRRAGRGETW
jgi:hypothetical protein